MPKKSLAPKVLAFLLVIESASLVGLLSMHRFPHFVRVVGRDIHSATINLTEAAALIVAIALLLVGRGVASRRRRAWWLALCLQVTLISIGLFHNIHRYISHRQTSHLIFGTFGFSHLLFELALLLLLIAFRNQFRKIIATHTRRGDFYYFLKVTSLSTLIATFMVFLDGRYFVSRPSLIQDLEITLKGFIGVSGPIPFSATRYQERMETILISIGVFIAATTILKILRPIDLKSRQSKEARIAVSDLLAKYPSNDSLGYFALRDDKTLIWSTNSKAVIAYSVKNGVMIASGDPLGDPECWPSAMENFITEADNHSWIPAVYGCTEHAGEIWRRETGLEALEMGDEAIIEVASYTLDTPQMKNVRQTINRARKDGSTVFTKQIAEMELKQLAEFEKLAHSWRRGGEERGFSMALDRFCSPEDQEAVISWAELNGEYVAFLQFAPWGSDGLSLDLMRRSHESPPGINELLINATIEYARENKIARLSLNFATFRSIFERGERLGAGPITRFNHRVLKLASRFVQMESLYRFNSKFQPIWEPRFLLFPSVGKLAKISIAVLQIESFLPDSPFDFLKKKVSK
jgi:lysyl-tRNA synthetase class 2